MLDSSPLTNRRLRAILDLLPNDATIRGNSLWNLIIEEEDVYVGYIDTLTAWFSYWGKNGMMDSESVDFIDC